jgi:hypothetical protein
MRGQDIIAHKRAVSRAFPSIYDQPIRGFSSFYGDRFVAAIKGAQLIMKLPTTGEIDKATHEALEQRKKPTTDEWAFDDYAIWLAANYCKDHPALTVRDKVIKAAFYWYGNRSKIAYDQYRPFQLCKPQQIPTRWDCSAFVTNCHYAGGAKDPNGRNYDGLGYTGTLISHGVRVNFRDLEPGDMIFYGFASGHKAGFPTGSPTHVALYVGDGDVLSMGSYPMKYLPYDYRKDINSYIHYSL